MFQNESLAYSRLLLLSGGCCYGVRRRDSRLGSPAFTGTQPLHVIILFFFARPTDPPSREGGRWEAKHFMGIA